MTAKLNRLVQPNTGLCFFSRDIPNRGKFGFKRLNICSFYLNFSKLRFKSWNQQKNNCIWICFYLFYTFFHAQFSCFTQGILHFFHAHSVRFHACTFEDYFHARNWFFTHTFQKYFTHGLEFSRTECLKLSRKGSTFSRRKKKHWPSQTVPALGTTETSLRHAYRYRHKYET